MVRVLGISRSLPRRSIPWLIILMLAATPVLIIGCSQQADSATEHGAIPQASAATPASGTGKTRTYYIAADEVDWDYAPDGRNRITGQPFDDAANVFVENGPDRIGKVYHKSIYREYTDQSFATRKEADPKWQHLGTLGPAIHAEVGDSIQIVFKNNTQFPASIHPHGVFYQKNAEGAPYNDGTSGADQDDDAVAPGETYTYNWEVPERAGPGPHDPSSVIWMYHSHTDEIADGYAGLVGPMIITRQGSANPDGSPNDVDREVVTMFSVIDENASPYLEKNIQDFAQQPDSVEPDDEGFGESNLMHSINGYVYGNLPGLTMKQGERVRWYVLGMGNEVDLHTPHWHGQTLLMGGMRMDMVELLPMSMKVMDMTPDNPGTWLYHCHVNDHIQAGMQALFTITP